MVHAHARLASPSRTTDVPPPFNKAGVQLRAEILSPAARLSKSATPSRCPTRLIRTARPETRSMRKLAIHLAGVTDCRLAVRLVPLPPNEGLAPKPPRATALSDW